ncbi:MAG: phosphomethylpyrimidine synthase ThiC, partial [Firmicutes bacterium]|nr:phosphomethylpyrimidine synthase ThiC [Bacillota bacterium]
MAEYATQMEAARKGIVTKEMEIVSKKENIDIKELMALMAEGKIIIPANKNHKSLDPEAVGMGMRTKINVNLGISKDCANIDKEMEKVKAALEMKAEAIMDLSSYGQTKAFRQRLIQESNAMVGTVPMYDVIGYHHKRLQDIMAEEFIEVVRAHAEDGVDFQTIHIGINRATAERFKKNGRLMNFVSRGGTLVYSWMELTGKEN